jgi:hypothetical protein
MNLSLLLSIFAVVSATTIVVSSSTGIDVAWCGTPGAPCRTLSFAVARSAPHDTIALVAGDEFEANATTLVMHSLVIASTPPRPRARLIGVSFNLTATSALTLTSLQVTGAMNNSFVVAPAAAAVAVVDCVFNDIVASGSTVLDINGSLTVLSTRFINITIMLIYGPSNLVNGLMIVRDGTAVVFDNVTFVNLVVDDEVDVVHVTLSNTTASVLLRNVFVEDSFSVVLRFWGNGSLVVTDVAMPRLSVLVSTSSAFDAMVANSTFARCPADGVALAFFCVSSPRPAVGFANVALRDVEFVNNVGRSFLFDSYGTNVVPYHFTFNRCTFADNYGGFATMVWLAKHISNAVIADVVNCEFRNNTALSLIQQGGAVFVSGNINLTFTHCLFADNIAAVAGDAIAAEASDWYTLISLMLVHTTIRGTAPSRSYVTGSFSTLALENTVVIGRARSLVDVTWLTYGMFQNAHFSCLPGWWAQLQRANSSATPVIAVTSDARCVPCGISVYNVGIQTVSLVNDTVGRLQTRGCLPCPVGARFNCSGSSVGSSLGVSGPTCRRWSMRTQHLHF